MMPDGQQPTPQPVNPTPGYMPPTPAPMPNQMAAPQQPYAPYTPYAQPMVPNPPAPQPAWPNQPMQPMQPMQPTPGPQPQWPAMAAAAPAFTPPAGQAAKKRLLQALPHLSRTQILAITLAAVLIAAGVVTYLIIQHRPISLEDVTAATSTVSNLEQDLNDATNDYNDMTIGTDTSDATIAADVQTINSKLDDAQKQYDTLEKSPVLNNSDVSKKFDALKAKFGPFVTYLRQNTADNKVLAPIVNDFMTKMQALAQQNPSTAPALLAYIQNMKTIVDSTSQKLQTVTVQSDTNKQGLAALKTYLQSLSKIIAKVQSDAAAGKDEFTLDDDLYSTYNAEDTFSKAITNVDDQELADQQRLDPEREVTELFTAINTLTTTFRN